MASMVSVIQYVVEKFVIASTEIFRPYSSEWFNAVAQLILNDQFGEAGVHYFCFDLLLILVQWISEGHFQPSTTSSKALCNRLLEYCIRYSWSKNYLVQKRNLHLVETMVDILKDVITVDMKILLEHLNLTEIDNENAFGINLLQSVLKNMKKPCKLCDEADNNHHIFLYIINKLSSKHARIYKPAAYVSGLTLHALSETDGGTFRGMLHSAIVKITGTTSDRSKFLLCLSEITKNEASFADSFFAELLTRLPVLHGHLKALCLEIFISFAGRRKDLFVDLKGHGFLETFSSHDHECQLVSVKLLHSLLPQLSVTQIEEVVHVLFSFVKHPLVSCRRRFAELCCSMIDKLSEIHSSSLKAKTAIGSLTEYSLSLLTDREESVRSVNTKCFEILKSRSFYRKIVFLWWCDEKRLSFRSAARLESILSLYSHSPGKDFLGQATSFMFDLSSRSPDFSRPLYDRPLEDCNFVDMHVPTHWRSRYAQFEIPTFMSFSKLLEKVSHTHTAQGETEMGLTQSTELSTSAWPLLTPTADEAVLPGSPGKSPETYGSVWNELSGNFELDAAAGMQAAGSDLLPSEHGVPEGSIGRDFKLLKRRILKDAEQKQFYANLRKQQYPRRQVCLLKMRLL
ncbi:hypothetical protein D918_09761 [Trichuris suis]|nr:hypothetical protein D918_09761 [Trichuris suis]